MRLFYIPILIVVLLTSCDTGSYRQAEGSVWATLYHITYRADRDMADSITAVMRQVELSLSPFCDSSLVTRINRGESMVTDSLLRRVFAASQHVNSISGGRFDPTVAPLVNLWGFGYEDPANLPDSTAVAEALLPVGIGDCRIENGTMIKKSADTQFNFSAITKGLGCDAIGEMMRRNGITDYMVEIGGEIALGGKNPRGEAWHIMIDTPVENDTAIVHDKLTMVELTDCGIATSGNYRNYRDTAKGRIGHTIDPRTGYPVQTQVLSATVIAADAMTADALATACMTMQPDSAMKMIDGYTDAAALLVTADSCGRWTLHRTSRFPEER